MSGGFTLSFIQGVPYRVWGCRLDFAGLGDTLLLSRTPQIDRKSVPEVSAGRISI